MIKWIALIVMGGAGITGFTLWNHWQKAHADASAPGRPTTAIADLRNIKFFVNAAGEINPAEQVSVRPEINGRIETLPVDVGDIVKKGATLFSLNDKELQQQLASNMTDIDKAKLGLEKAARDYKRAQQLLADKLISQEVYDDTKTAFDLAKNALESSYRAKAITDENLAYTVVHAPFDCTVLTRPVSMGQAVAGSGGFSGGTEVLTVADLNAMIINAQVNQADVPRLKSGEPVEITVEAVADLPRPLYLLAPGGRRFDQEMAAELAGRLGGFSLLCGRYEGVDQRVADHLVDGELSVGDYVLAGGELAALVVVEAVARLLPEVLGNEDSALEESFTDGLLEYPQYTRPAEFRGWPVPEVLRSGDHGAVAAWRRTQALLRTAERRSDLIERLVRASALSPGDVQALAEHGYDVPSGTEPE